MTTYALTVGGLGNQLFQLAAAIGVDADGDGRLVPRDPAPRFGIADLAPGLLTPVDEEDYARARQDEALTYRQPLRDFPAAFVRRPAWDVRPRVLSGYFQHPDWYESALATVVDGLLRAAPPGTRARPDGDPVVNVRGGDYARLGRMLPTSYYVTAMRHLRPSAARMVTDDEDRGAIVAGVLGAAGWDTMPPEPGSSPAADFWTLATAPVVVMANSTFAWWAVKVGDELFRRADLPRTVIAPKSWILGVGGELVAPPWIALD